MQLLIEHDLFLGRGRVKRHQLLDIDGFARPKQLQYLGEGLRRHLSGSEHLAAQANDRRVFFPQARHRLAELDDVQDIGLQVARILRIASVQLPLRPLELGRQLAGGGQDRDVHQPVVNARIVFQIVMGVSQPLGHAGTVHPRQGTVLLQRRQASRLQLPLNLIP